KTLRNGLRSLNIPPEAIEQVSLNLDQRPEELTVKNFITLADELQHYVLPLHSIETEQDHDF
ncbi:MAG: hypothetical protein H3C35_13605, partial [Bacteroidetes bacterium]|nr:hypothetical protein [Bacteroidota bacterium]